MKKILPLPLLILLFCTGPAAADTVMLYTVDRWITSEDRAGEEYIVLTMEDGFLETLFDAGHIIYNDYAPPLAQPDFNNRDRASLRLARSGGADYLVEVEMDYSPLPDEKAVLPASMEYRFSRVPDSRLFASGTLVPGDIQPESPDSKVEICRLLGTELARKFLESLNNR